ncbi:glucose-1-phosphate cytidylyltransferase [Gemmata sp. G18]|uniref:Glucose-1-phosphate cytidylyltransferase n=1 Tax=Gemmata palustris TaxID=2822762 RepID=A0ABS5C1E5_9BACT|nr:glucose-1-phosphate cytidylyltransferase [Gemmata palustris]MBP3959796.1 glucose-1-phosphate cytidylyltransferase [Gemmata palustris]
MRAVILAGGLGTRLAEETETRPKPMVEIGGRPILWHIMSHYAAHWVTEFVVALGYKSDIIKRFFVEYSRYIGSLSVNLARGEVTHHEPVDVDWTVHLLDTGLHTNTGGRVKRAAPWVCDDTFMLTYGDGVSDVDVQALLRFHRHSGKLATVTAVRPPARFGELVFDGDLVSAFAEKPQTGDGWINGGFFVLEPKVLDYIGGDDESFEHDVLPRLVAEGELAAYKHAKFWQCMDTLRDKRQLEALWQEGRAPWRAA